VTAAVFLLQLGAGLTGYLLSKPDEGKPVTVAALQGNVGSNREWTRASWEKTKKIYIQYTAEAAKAGATVLLFPETFVPDNLYDRNELGQFVSMLARENRVTIFCGAFYTDDAGEQYNAVFMVHPDGRIDEIVYAKRHLVPFGEYVPWRGFFEKALPLIIEMCMVDEDLSFGKGSALFTYEGDKVGALICFDSIYEGLTLESVRDGAELLVLPTNDSWFTDSTAVYMHSSQARLRAIESCRWIVRSADTGISSIIDPDGNSHDLTPPLVEGMSMATARVSTARTLYSYIGNLLVYLLIAALVALALSEVAYCLWQRRKEKHTA
jgi:apolipoprotein N-acyltransferase